MKTRMNSREVPQGEANNTIPQVLRSQDSKVTEVAFEMRLRSMQKPYFKEKHQAAARLLAENEHLQAFIGM